MDIDFITSMYKKNKVLNYRRFMSCGTCFYQVIGKEIFLKTLLIELRASYIFEVAKNTKINIG